VEATFIVTVPLALMVPVRFSVPAPDIDNTEEAAAVPTRVIPALAFIVPVVAVMLAILVVDVPPVMVKRPPAVKVPAPTVIVFVTDPVGCGIVTAPVVVRVLVVAPNVMVPATAFAIIVNVPIGYAGETFRVIVGAVVEFMATLYVSATFESAPG
jgi:hypothetical protein